MSTRIHNGFRIKDAVQFSELHTILQEIKEITERQKEQAVLSQFKRYALRFIYLMIQHEAEYDVLFKKLTAADLIQEVELSDFAQHSIWDYFTQYLSRAVLTASTSARFEVGECDLKAELVLVPHDGSIYGLHYFGREGHYEDSFKQHAAIVPFEYFDNVDKPEDITEDEWRFRSKVWGEIFSRSYTPSEIGTTVKLTDPTPDIYYQKGMRARKDKLLAMLGMIDDRNSVVDKFAHQRIRKEIIGKKMPEDTSALSPGAFLSLNEKAIAEAKTEQEQNTAYWQEVRSPFDSRIDALLTPEALKRNLLEVAITK